MDATKGIHAGITSFFALFIAYIVYDFVSNFYNSINDTTLQYVLWATYILVLLVAALAVPALIAFSEDSDASILSMLAGMAFYFGGVLFIRLFYPLMQVFVGDGGTLQGLLSDQFHIQIMSFITILGILFVLVIGPITMSTLPEWYNEDVAKTAKEALG